MRNNSFDFGIMENELNLSTQNIMDSLNKKIENDRRKKEKSKRIAVKITAAAAAAVVCIAGIKITNTVISSNRRDNTGVNSIVNKDIGNNMGIQPASYLSDAFVMKVYAAEDGDYISVDADNKVLIDKLAKTTGYSVLSNGGTEVMIKLPVMCEGEKCKISV